MAGGGAAMKARRRVSVAQRWVAAGGGTIRAAADPPAATDPTSSPQRRGEERGDRAWPCVRWMRLTASWSGRPSSHWSASRVSTPSGSPSWSGATGSGWPPTTSSPATPPTCSARRWPTGRPAHRRLPDQAPNVRLYNPDLEVDGWESRHTVVEVVCDDRPFLVDSVTMVLQRHGWGIHLVVHPVLDVERTADGELVGVGGDTQESWIHLEVDRQASPESALDVRQDLLGRARRRPLGGRPTGRPCRPAPSRWPTSSARSPAAVPAEERQAAKELLDWMVDDHFTFLGYREYELVADAEGREVLRGRARDAASACSATTSAHPRSRLVADLPELVRARLHEPRLLLVTKANARSTVHRPDYLEYVGVKVIDDQRQGDRRAPLRRPLHRPRLPGQRRRHPVPAAQDRRRHRARRASARTATTAASCGTSSRRSRATTCSRSRSTSCSRSPPAS